MGGDVVNATLSPDIMFITNKHHRYHELFQTVKPYRGEPPTLAGFLIYPDTPVKMETTSRKAFCFRPVPQPTGGEVHNLISPKSRAMHNNQQRSYTMSSGRREPSSENKETGGNEQGKTSDQSGSKAAPLMLSQYQKDFPPPPCPRRCTPALPYPDNIGINPAFRLEFSTVQKEAYPAWSIQNHWLNINSSAKQSLTKD